MYSDFRDELSLLGALGWTTFLYVQPFNANHNPNPANIQGGPKSIHCQLIKNRIKNSQWG